MDGQQAANEAAGFSHLRTLRCRNAHARCKCSLGALADETLARLDSAEEKPAGTNGGSGIFSPPHASRKMRHIQANTAKSHRPRRNVASEMHTQQQARGTGASSKKSNVSRSIHR